jgi:hypothetical protein
MWSPEDRLYSNRRKATSGILPRRWGEVMIDSFENNYKNECLLPEGERGYAVGNVRRRKRPTMILEHYFYFVKGQNKVGCESKFRERGVR